MTWFSDHVNELIHQINGFNKISTEIRDNVSENACRNLFRGTTSAFLFKVDLVVMFSGRFVETFFYQFPVPMDINMKILIKL